MSLQLVNFKIMFEVLLFCNYFVACNFKWLFIYTSMKIYKISWFIKKLVSDYEF